MTDYFVVFGDFLTALPTYLLNGVLATVYWLGESGAALVSILCAGLIIRFVDQRVQSRAAFRPGRSGREAATPDLYTAQITTAIILVLWVISQWGMGAPVPWLGAAMWIAGTVILLLVHMQEHTLLWNMKSGIAIYSLAVIGSRLYLAYTAQLSADQWAALIGTSESASAVIANTRGNVTTIILWALWLVIPLGYFAMLLQQVLINPMSLVNPLAGASELINRYRTRR
ncbi:hypothetical protein BECAL_03032 [Bellilinea caldifistulae]|uniref:Uncharacterized protein n=1 Tax=Bellilinea caldifistulae TaxID=360411 RepID=A0A0P6XI49_9CHLR|nr:hypothetical protein [Bellilinea caldifistulae]KPL74615.1 hypothetical protein AC812_12560 [Bellilinea caldifistulae]GAP11838.1 hypothetical protein BECAL_03032 [Bellilinea caldifistulae]